MSNYYDNLGSTYTRAEMFLNNNSIDDVEKEILKELNIDNLEQLKEQQPDAFNFIISLKKGSNIMIKG